MNRSRSPFLALLAPAVSRFESAARTKPSKRRFATARSAPPLKAPRRRSLCRGAAPRTDLAGRGTASPGRQAQSHRGAESAGPFTAASHSHAELGEGLSKTAALG